MCPSRARGGSCPCFSRSRRRRDLGQEREHRVRGEAALVISPGAILSTASSLHGLLYRCTLEGGPQHRIRGNGVDETIHGGHGVHVVVAPSHRLGSLLGVRARYALHAGRGVDPVVGQDVVETAHHLDHSAVLFTWRYF